MKRKKRRWSSDGLSRCFSTNMSLSVYNWLFFFWKVQQHLRPKVFFTLWEPGPGASLKVWNHQETKVEKVLLRGRTSGSNKRWRYKTQWDQDQEPHQRSGPSGGRAALEPGEGASKRKSLKMRQEVKVENTVRPGPGPEPGPGYGQWGKPFDRATWRDSSSVRKMEAESFCFVFHFKVYFCLYLCHKKRLWRHLV